jgi:hypothetical protein
MQLPAGVLGYPAPAVVSIEMWITTSTSGNSGNSIRVFQFGSHVPSSNIGSFILFKDTGTGKFVLGSYDLNNAYVAVTDSTNRAFNGQSNLHVVLVLYNGGRSYVYFNGALAGRSTYGFYVASGTSGELNYVGFGTDMSTSGFSGSVDEFRVWSGALHPNTIAAHYAAGPDESLGIL